jgi:hypothetical protein
MSERPAGPILDGLGVELDLDDDDLVTEVVVIAKVSRLSDGGGTAVVIANSSGMDWVSQLGLIEAARQVTSGGLAEDA